MLKFDLDYVYGGWDPAAVAGSPDEIYITIRTDRYEPMERYVSLRTILKLYECAEHELPSDEHPLRGGFPLTKRDGSLVLELTPHTESNTHSIETTYQELRKTVSALLREVLKALNENSTEEERLRGIDHVSHNYSLIGEFSDIYKSLMGGREGKE